MPVWTSSKINSAPRSLVTSRHALRNAGAATRTPPSPCTGSTNTAAVLADTADANTSTSLNGTCRKPSGRGSKRSEEHTSELRSRLHLVCRLLLEKKKKNKQ